MKPLPKPGILEIAAYAPGRATAPGVERPLKLSANENSLGCSDLARDAYLAAAAELSLYPDSHTTRLREAIAEAFQLAPERLIFGAGSDEIFSIATQAYLGAGDNIVQPQFGFAAWAIAARAAGGRVKSAPERDFVVDVNALLRAVDARTRLVFLANPANPTGAWLPFGEIARLHAGLPANVLLVLDGAYAECATALPEYADGLSWAADKSNVLVTRTFSKMYGLASLRIGWGYGPAHVVDALNRIRLPFSMSRAGEAAALAALGDEAFLERSVELVAAGRERLAAGLHGMGLRTLPSAANFVTVSCKAAPVAARGLEAALAGRGILVRGLANYGMPDWLRITVGTSEQIDRVLAAMLEILEA